MLKRNFDAARAAEVAAEVEGWLKPFCTRIQIVGSLRRQRPRVSDVDLLLIPRTVVAQGGLFAGTGETASLLDEELFALKERELIHLRQNGPKYKRFIHNDTGVPVDLYLTSMPHWYTMLVIRTGSAEHNKRLCATARRQGFILHANGSGIERVVRHGKTKPVQPKSERGLFQMFKLPWQNPEERV
ncbi:MAG: hypothetical protein ACTSX8_07950, partial [Alphaproteobacteria bacterium]